jgi:hypothetical protein
MREDISWPVNIANFRLGSHSEISDKLNSSRSVSAQNLLHETRPPMAAELPPPPPPPPLTLPLPGTANCEELDEAAAAVEERWCCAVCAAGAAAREDEEDDTGKGSSNRVLAFCNSLYSLVISVAAISEIYLAYSRNTNKKREALMIITINNCNLQTGCLCATQSSEYNIDNNYSTEHNTTEHNRPD